MIRSRLSDERIIVADGWLSDLSGKAADTAVQASTRQQKMFQSIFCAEPVVFHDNVGAKCGLCRDDIGHGPSGSLRIAINCRHSICGPKTKAYQGQRHSLLVIGKSPFTKTSKPV
jgi:hypothetical protein